MKSEFVAPKMEVTEVDLVGASVIENLGDVVVGVLEDVRDMPRARSEAVAATIKMLEFLNHELDELQEAYPEDDAWCLRDAD